MHKHNKIPDEHRVLKEKWLSHFYRVAENVLRAEWRAKNLSVPVHQLKTGDLRVPAALTGLVIAALLIFAAEMLS